MIDIDNSSVKYCVSWFTIRVANIGTTIAVESWNNHTIRGSLCSHCKIVAHDVQCRLSKGSEFGQL